MMNVGDEITYLGPYNGAVTWDYTPFPGLTVLSRPLRTYRCGLGWIALCHETEGQRNDCAWFHETRSCSIHQELEGQETQTGL